MQLKSSEDEKTNETSSEQSYNSAYRTPAQMTDNVYRAPASNGTSGIARILLILGIFIVGAFAVFLGLDKYKKLYGKSEYIPGTYNNQVYTNEYFGIQIPMNSQWKVTKSVYDAESVKTTLDAKKPVTEFTAENATTIEVIGFSVSQTPYNVNESSVEMNKLLDELKDEFKSEMTRNGYTLSSIDRDTITIAGQTLEGYKMTGTMSGSTVKLSLVQYYVFKGNYVGFYTASSTSEQKAKQTLTNNIQKLN